MVENRSVTAEKVQSPRRQFEIPRPQQPTAFEHGRVVGRVCGILFDFVEKNELGVICGAATGFRTSGDSEALRSPDVAFVRADRVARIPVDGYADFAPDLAVEVVATDDSFSSVDDKVRCWLDSGSRQVWVLVPQTRRVIVYRGNQPLLNLGEADDVPGGDVLSGFRVAAGRFF